MLSNSPISLSTNSTHTRTHINVKVISKRARSLRSTENLQFQVYGAGARFLLASKRACIAPKDPTRTSRALPESTQDRERSPVDLAILGKRTVTWCVGRSGPWWSGTATRSSFQKSAAFAVRLAPDAVTSRRSVTLALFFFLFLLCPFLTSAPETNVHAEARGPFLSRVQPPQRGATRVDGTPVGPVVATGRPAALEPVEIGPLPAYALALCHTRKQVEARKRPRSSPPGRFCRWNYCCVSPSLSLREHSRSRLWKKVPRTMVGRYDRSARTPITLALIEIKSPPEEVARALPGVSLRSGTKSRKKKDRRAQSTRCVALVAVTRDAVSRGQLFTPLIRSTRQLWSVATILRIVVSFRRNPVLRSADRKAEVHGSRARARRPRWGRARRVDGIEGGGSENERASEGRDGELSEGEEGSRGRDRERER